MSGPEGRGGPEPGAPEAGGGALARVLGRPLSKIPSSPGRKESRRAESAGRGSWAWAVEHGRVAGPWEKTLCPVSLPDQDRRADPYRSEAAGCPVPWNYLRETQAAFQLTVPARGLTLPVAFAAGQATKSAREPLPSGSISTFEGFRVPCGPLPS